MPINECQWCKQHTPRCLCEEPGYNGAPPFPTLKIGRMLNCGVDDSGIFLWALKPGAVYHQASSRGYSKAPGVAKFAVTTTEPGVLVQRQVGNWKGTKPVFVPVRKLLIWHSWVILKPVWFDNSATCRARGAEFSEEARVQIFNE